MGSNEMQAVHLVVAALAQLPPMERQRALADLDVAARERRADLQERRVSEQQWAATYVLAPRGGGEGHRPSDSPWDALRPETD
mgnify:CR=1 FL=1